MFTRHFVLSLLLFTLLASLGVARDESRAGQIAPLCWERLLDWLPEDTETVVVAQSPFEIPKPRR